MGIESVCFSRNCFKKRTLFQLFRFGVLYHSTAELAQYNGCGKERFQSFQGKLTGSSLISAAVAERELVDGVRGVPYVMQSLSTIPWILEMWLLELQINWKRHSVGSCRRMRAPIK